MIKDNSSIQRGFCDSCHVQIFECAEFEWMEGQELVYTPILCEKCGGESSKFMGELIKVVEELIKKIETVEKLLQK